MGLETTSDQSGYMEKESEKINNSYPGCLKAFEQAVVKNKSSYLDELLLYIPDIIIKKHDVILSDWWSYSLSTNRDPLDTNINAVIDFLDKKLASGTSIEDLKLIGSTLCLIASNELIQNMYLLSFLCPDFDYMHVNREKYNKQIALCDKPNDKTQNDNVKQSAIDNNQLRDLQKINKALGAVSQVETLDESLNSQTNVNLEKSTKDNQIISTEKHQMNHRGQQSSSIENNRLSNEGKSGSPIKESIEVNQLKIQKKIEVFKKNIVHSNNINNSVRLLIKYIPSGKKRIINIILPSTKVNFYKLFKFLKIPFDSTVSKSKKPASKIDYLVQVKSNNDVDGVEDNNVTINIDKSLKISCQARTFEFGSCKFYNIPIIIDSSGLNCRIPLISAFNSIITIFIKQENIIKVQSGRVQKKGELGDEGLQTISFFINKTGRLHVEKLLGINNPIESYSKIILTLLPLYQNSYVDLEKMYPNKLLV